MATQKVETIRPYGADGPDKDRQVRSMFNHIAPGYDRMNLLMSMGLDRGWRRRTVAAVAAVRPSVVLDIATGTGDVAIQLARAIPDAHIHGVDLSEGMVQVGVAKVADAGLDNRITLQVADALDLPFADNSVDAITVSFGVRNFKELHRGYTEMLRVLRPGGLLAVLELTTPSSPLLVPAYNIYTKGIIPVLGKILSGDYDAYRYLQRSIAAVPARDKMCALMRDAGFADAAYANLFPGVCALYTARK